MPNPTAHADDMKSPAIIKPDEMPAFWWLNPWGYAINLKRALHAVHLLSETTEAAYQSAKTVIKQKDELADYRGKQHNDFLRQVEVTLKPACPHLYEDTIGYVQWAADEIKRLRASLSVMTEDRDAYVAKVESLRKEIESLRAELEINEGVSEGAFRDLAAVEKHRNQALKDLVACQKHIEKLEAKRKLKAKKKGGRK